ncbi:MAG: hypothetical protein M3P50_02865, partial [Actinomycetota bacterium]|nr:hypothetical protein [Actinomycetota bacterium]
MRTRPIRLVQAFVVAAATAFLLAVLIAGGDSAPAVQRAGFELIPYQPGGPAGVVFLERSGGRLTGTRVVWGLEPGSRHYNALRGPEARCRGRLAQVVRALPPLVADENGVAFGRVDEPAPSSASADGLALT